MNSNLQKTQNAPTSLRKSQTSADQVDAEAIAAGLSEAQKRAVLTDDSYFAFGHKGKWAGMTTPTAKIMFGLGLIEKPYSLVRPTPLGLAVRDVLMKEKG